MGVPVSRSDPRRTTIIGVIGLVVGTLMIVLVLFAGNLGGDDKTENSRTSFDVGPADLRAETIAKDGPIGFNDTATGSRPIFVQHTGTDPKTGWTAFDASDGSCTLTWRNDRRNFDCGGRTISADGGSLHHYPVKVDQNNDVIVDLSVDATTTTSSSP